MTERVVKIQARVMVTLTNGRAAQGSMLLSWTAADPYSVRLSVVSIAMPIRELPEVWHTSVELIADALEDDPDRVLPSGRVAAVRAVRSGRNAFRFWLLSEDFGPLDVLATVGEVHEFVNRVQDACGPMGPRRPEIAYCTDGLQRLEQLANSEARE